MASQERMKRYRELGGDAELVRVEVLVPAEGRARILACAEEMRAEHRQQKARLQPLLERALDLYGARILDNIDLDRLPRLEERYRVVANALIERGDARAFALGRRMLADLKG